MSLPDAATADILQKLAQALAFFVGSLWVLLNYLLDRTHIRRLQLSLDTTVLKKENRYDLIIAISVNNPGRTNVEITREGSGIMIFELTRNDGVANVRDSQWDDEGAVAVDIFTGNMSREGYMSIEPGLTVKEERLILLPAREAVFLLRLRVLRKRSWLRYPRRTWNTTKVIMIGQ